MCCSVFFNWTDNKKKKTQVTVDVTPTRPVGQSGVILGQTEWNLILLLLFIIAGTLDSLHPPSPSVCPVKWWPRFFFFKRFISLQNAQCYITG